MTNTTDYNYMEAMAEDIKEYIKNEVTLSDYSDRDELENYLNDTLLTEDSVTGNGSGSYTFNTYKAEEYICHNLDLLAEACEEFGTVDPLKEGGRVLRCNNTLLLVRTGDCGSSGRYGRRT